MSEIDDAAIKFEAKKIALKQSKDGTIVTLVIHPDDTRNVTDLWETWAGQRYMVAMVGLTDDEQPIKTKTSEGIDRTVQQAGILCHDPKFQDFLSGECNTLVMDEDMAAKVLRSMLGIESRSELRTNRDAQKAFAVLRESFYEELNNASVKT